MSPDAAKVLRQFRVLFNSVRKHFRAVESAAGVSGALLWALGLVADHPGIGVNELAESMEVHQSTASNLLRTLRGQGLVADRRSEVDRRAIHLFITKDGQKVLKKAPRPYSGVLPDALLELDPRTLKRLQRDLGELIAVLSPDEDGAYTPLAQQRR